MACFGGSLPDGYYVKVSDYDALLDKYQKLREALDGIQELTGGSRGQIAVHIESIARAALHLSKLR